MTCDLTHTTLHGYCDGELDAVRAAEFERHLEHCSECRMLLAETRALGSRLRQNDLYQRSSDELRQRVANSSVWRDRKRKRKDRRGRILCDGCWCRRLPWPL